MKLSDEQVLIVNHTYGPAAVLSGAGSGKTHTIINRIEKLSHITDPHKIVALTFTNSAANEMKLRASRISEQCKDIVASTYHKFCGTMLRKYGKAIGINPSFDILSKQKYITFIEYIKSSNEYYESLKDFPSASKLADIFSTITNTDISIRELIHNKKYQNYEDEIQNLYMEVKEAGLEQQKLSFDDMLVYMNKLLENKDICYKIANSFEFLMVDEFQDTNDLQLRMLLLLSEYNSNIVIIGDISQSIYKFRGAKVQNIQNFIDSFDSCEIYSLTTNYRSTQEILDAANDMMNRHVRSWEYLDMKSSKHGEKPVIKCHRNDYDQADWIINKIEQELKYGYDLSQIAIIERKSMSSFKLENELVKTNIPFVKIGGYKFLEYAVVDDILSFLSVIVRKSDKFSWFNVLKLIPGIGAKTATTIANQCKEKDFIESYNKKKYYNDLKELTIQLNAFKSYKKDIKTLLNKVSEYYFALREAKANTAKKSSTQQDALDKIAKDKVIVAILTDMAIHYNSIVEFLDDIALDSVNTSSDEDRLVVTTIHGAKGLEWPVTIIIDALETDSSITNDEEELRCMYVAMTRAEEELIISVPELSIVNGMPVYNDLIHFVEGSKHLFEIK
ncbi:MAG: ATP-dependent helicase [Bacilli bacterium]|nr:ATP-dependent helicase [Bacilli bacterium]MBQ8218691.1 ATP-dependent helicase [Bacilli bacterium]